MCGGDFSSILLFTSWWKHIVLCWIMDMNTTSIYVLILILFKFIQGHNPWIKSS
jgi:hypothetical protein